MIKIIKKVVIIKLKNDNDDNNAYRCEQLNFVLFQQHRSKCQEGWREKEKDKGVDSNPNPP